MNNAVTTKYVAIDPANMTRILRPATELEIKAFRAANPDRVWEQVTRVGDVFIDSNCGPGAWFGGAGF